MEDFLRKPNPKSSTTFVYYLLEMDTPYAMMVLTFMHFVHSKIHL